MSPEYAWCYHCGRPRPLRADGTFRKHRAPDIRTGFGTLDCPGSWTYPAAAWRTCPTREAGSDESARVDSIEAVLDAHRDHLAHGIAEAVAPC